MAQLYMYCSSGTVQGFYDQEMEKTEYTTKAVIKL